MHCAGIGNGATIATFSTQTLGSIISKADPVGAMREHATAARRSASALATVALLGIMSVAGCINCPGFNYAGRVQEGLEGMKVKTLRSMARRFNVPVAARMTKTQMVNAIMNGRFGWNLKAPSLVLGEDPTTGDSVIGYPGMASAFAMMGSQARRNWVKEMRTYPAGTLQRKWANRLKDMTGHQRPATEAVEAALGQTENANPNGHPSDLKRLADEGCLEPVPGVSASTQRVAAYDYMSASQLKRHRVRVNEYGEPVSARYGNAVKVPMFDPTTGRLKTDRNGSLKLVRVELRVGYLDTSEVEKWSGRVKTGTANTRSPVCLRRIIIEGGDYAPDNVHQSAAFMCWVAVLGEHGDDLPSIALPNPPSMDEVNAAVDNINRNLSQSKQVKNIDTDGINQPYDFNDCEGWF